MLRISTSRPCPFSHDCNHKMGQNYMKDWILVHKGRFTPWTMKIGPWKMAFSHGPTWWSNMHGLISLKNQFTKPLGPSLGVNQMWNKRNDHAPKVNVLIFLIYMLKKCSSKIIQVWPFSCLLLSSSSLPQITFHQKIIITSFLYTGPCLFLLEHLFCLSHRKTCWTMSMDNVGLKICLFGDLELHGHLSFFPWCKPKWSQDEFNNKSQMLHGLGMTSWSMV